jgi:hypothetical protein
LDKVLDCVKYDGLVGYLITSASNVADGCSMLPEKSDIGGMRSPHDLKELRRLIIR